jgi:hypothetical protein
MVHIYQTMTPAKDQGNRIVGELKDGGYCPENAALIIHDETGQTVYSIPF